MFLLNFRSAQCRCHFYNSTRRTREYVHPFNGVSFRNAALLAIGQQNISVPTWYIQIRTQS